jgi:hypothetical protein
MSNRTHSASRIETLRISLRPGASTITQLAAALMKRDRTRAERISVAGFFSPALVPIRVPLATGPQRSK